MCHPPEQTALCAYDKADIDGGFGLNPHYRMFPNAQVTFSPSPSHPYPHPHTYTPTLILDSRVSYTQRELNERMKHFAAQANAEAKAMRLEPTVFVFEQV